MTAKILHKSSTVVGKAPTVDDIDRGELAINLADGILFTRLEDDTIKELSGIPGKQGVVGPTEINIPEYTNSQYLGGNYGIAIEVTEDTVLQGAVIDAEEEGSVTFQVRPEPYTDAIESFTYDVLPGLNTISFGIALTPGRYSIQRSSGVFLRRASGSEVSYPINAGSFSIIGRVTNSTMDTSSFYYWFLRMWASAPGIEPKPGPKGDPADVTELGEAAYRDVDESLISNAPLMPRGAHGLGISAWSAPTVTLAELDTVSAQYIKNSTTEDAPPGFGAFFLRSSGMRNGRGVQTAEEYYKSSGGHPRMAIRKVGSDQTPWAEMFTTANITELLKNLSDAQDLNNDSTGLSTAGAVELITMLQEKIDAASVPPEFELDEDGNLYLITPD